MTAADTETGNGHHRYLTQMDEMSLADEKSAQTRDSEPDTLDVSDDSRAILQGTMNDLRRPMLLVAATVGMAVVLGVVLGSLARRGSVG